MYNVTDKLITCMDSRIVSTLMQCMYIAFVLGAT